MLTEVTKYIYTRRYGALRAPTSSSCRGLVAFGHLQGPLGPLDSCKKKKLTPIFLLGAPPYSPQPPPPYPLHRFFFFFFTPIFFIGAPPIPPPPAATPPTNCTDFFLQPSWILLMAKIWQNGMERRGPGSVFYVDTVCLSIKNPSTFNV